jgi:hypothetical protein
MASANVKLRAGEVNCWRRVTGGPLLSRVAVVCMVHGQNRS